MLRLPLEVRSVAEGEGGGKYDELDAIAAMLPYLFTHNSARGQALRCDTVHSTVGWVDFGMKNGQKNSVKTFLLKYNSAST